MVVAEAPRRTVDRIGDEHVVARLRASASSGSVVAVSPDGTASARMRALDGGDRVLQIGDGRQAVQAVADALVLAARRLLELGDSGKSIVVARKTGVLTAPRNLRGVRPRCTARVAGLRWRRSCVCAIGRAQVQCARGSSPPARDGVAHVDDDRIRRRFERRELAREQRRRHVAMRARREPRGDRVVVAGQMDEADIARAADPSRYACRNAEHASTALPPRRSIAAISAASRSSHGQRSASVSGVPAAILRRSPPDENRRRRRTASRDRGQRLPDHGLAGPAHAHHHDDHVRTPRFDAANAPMLPNRAPASGTASRGRERRVAMTAARDDQRAAGDRARARNLAQEASASTMP